MTDSNMPDHIQFGTYVFELSYTVLNIKRVYNIGPAFQFNYTTLQAPDVESPPQSWSLPEFVGLPFARDLVAGNTVALVNLIDSQQKLRDRIEIPLLLVDATSRQWVILSKFNTLIVNLGADFHHLFNIPDNKADMWNAMYAFYAVTGLNGELLINTPEEEARQKAERFAHDATSLWPNFKKRRWWQIFSG